MNEMYRTAFSRSGRRHNPLRHIAQVAMGRRWLETLHGTALCGVYVQSFPEDGEHGKPQYAGCRPCKYKWQENVVLDALREAGEPVSPREMRVLATKKGWPFADPRYALARLVRKGLIEKHDDGSWSAS